MGTVLITGSAGFIGFFVASSLLESGETVIGIDNFNSYYTPELKRARTDILRNYTNFVPLEMDLVERDAVKSCFAKYSPEIVFHSAAQAGVRHSLKNPHAYQQSNLEGFINLIEEAKQTGIKRFVYASSSSVYGGNTKMPYAEDDPVNTPVSLYAATKRANELIAYTYTHLWNLQTIGLRFFTVYGPWGRPDMAYWSFLEAILHDEPIKVFNFGKNRRDFTYIDEIVSGVIAALRSDRLEPYEIINLGNNTPVELMEFIELLESFAGKKAIKEMVPPQPGDVVATYADITRAQSKLDFQPRTALKEGLERFVSWYLENRDLVRKVREFRRQNK
ncbi:NAD-dependent epimerase/dehydratase family protein [Desulfomonile tiedjei]|uniref:Nucleoside-diphosphate-sugar epimerase n=1 Tax=Desulfomonile tiedjei (strain ATCC 49306 / DSM 6799 / DCB-1) TaxID=706587 RepID=I4C774_DESTA|nr:NAD-dependent epimerase/dehydratase family protein [Desulfomonile tiedjei]AFM25415.1 nucleoside-diphosphate-sugar epimerase [Desulfomonile tiedjei DSM 6799]